MIQKEVAEKLESKAKKKSFLRWLINYAYQVDFLKKVPPKSFSPAPKVDSAIIGLTSKPIQKFIFSDFPEFEEFLDKISGFSRKTIGKVSKILAKQKINISVPEELSSKRLEELDFLDFQNKGWKY